MILNLTPDIQAEMKYGGILFSTNNPFCGIFSYTKHVSLEFSKGTSLSDPFNVLEGQGKFRRHIKLSAINDISEKHVHEYLILALAQNNIPT